MSSLIRKLPTREEILSDKAADGAENDFNILVNIEPKADWVKYHPQTNVPYLPIERVEQLLTRIFGRWHVEVLSERLEANSIVVVVRLHYLHPDGSFRWTDGIGACPIQTKKGAGAADFMQMNTNGVQLAAPAAKSYAIKDAAETIGRLFGKDLSRKAQLEYSFLVERRRKPSIEIDSDVYRKAIEHIRKGGTIEEITANYDVEDSVLKAILKNV